jgi:hypothetical protein
MFNNNLPCRNFYDYGNLKLCTIKMCFLKHNEYSLAKIHCYLITKNKKHFVLVKPISLLGK